MKEPIEIAVTFLILVVTIIGLMLFLNWFVFGRKKCRHLFDKTGMEFWGFMGDGHAVYNVKYKCSKCGEEHSKVL